MSKSVGNFLVAAVGFNKRDIAVAQRVSTMRLSIIGFSLNFVTRVTNHWVHPSLPCTVTNPTKVPLRLFFNNNVW
ncbi:MAG: hypothetical protein AYK19_17400 [Theionarchaea archaeon DG-70-1]|nr:MAG: hypothetical protein AYK19_17400 [Theionarchaea archaeon DG-70-1]